MLAWRDAARAVEYSYLQRPPNHFSPSPNRWSSHRAARYIQVGRSHAWRGVLRRTGTKRWKRWGCRSKNGVDYDNPAVKDQLDAAW